MANPELSQRIRALPGELSGLENEQGTAERLRWIDALKDRARALEPLDGVEDMALADYDRDWLVRYTYNSNAIEGSTLTLEDTSLVLEGEFVPSDSPARYVFAARIRCSRRPVSTRCSRTSIRSWTATAGRDASCSTSCC